MTFLYLDIETIPAQTERAKDRIAASVKAPAQMKKAETIAAWEKDGKEQAIIEAIDKTSFDGGLGHVCCIGWAIGDQEVESESCLTIEEEAKRLNTFFRYVSDELPDWGDVTVVGHYISGFDIRFLTQRAIVLGVKLPLWWPHEAKPWGNEIFDTMIKWAGAKGTVSLDNLCFALGIEGKGDVHGSMVAQMFKDGKHEEIAQYCRDDVERVRQVHNKMISAFGE
jgi:DNA polymerase elongation subunit (family B)